MFQRFARSEQVFAWKNAERWRTMPAPMADYQTERAKKKPRCEDCFFHQNMLCALQDKKPCPTFRLAHPDGLRPPQQLSFVFRQERRNEPFVFRPATL
jgi:hypothetical protein